MQPFDDRLPDESDPQNEKVMAFLRLVHSPFARARSASEEEKQVLGRVRQRLFASSEGDSSSLKQHALPAQKRVWSKRFALMAAALVVALLVSSLLLLFNLEKRPSFLAAKGLQTIYALSGGWLQKFDAQNGKLLWKSSVQTSESQANSSTYIPASNGIVYITSARKISALRANDGSLLWSKDISGEIAIQAAFENTTFFVLTRQDSTTYNNHTSLKAFDALSGRELWQYAQDGLFLSFAVANNVVYGGINLRSPATSKNDPYTKLDIFALKAMDGSSLWRVHMDDSLLVSTSGEITAANGKIYVEANTLEETKTSAQGYSHLYVYDAINGAFLWRTPDSLNPILGTLLPGQQTVFAISGNSLYALYGQSGQLLWRYTNKSGGALNCSLVPQANTIFCLETEASSTYLVRLDTSDGQVKTRYLVEHFGVEGIQMVSSPSATFGDAPSVLLFPVFLTDEDNSYVVTPTGAFDAFDNQTGERLWSTHLIGMPEQVNLMLGG